MYTQTRDWHVTSDVSLTLTHTHSTNTHTYTIPASSVGGGRLMAMVDGGGYW
jgi:hypothetical protein